ncbi:MAG: ATP-dependent Clp protease adaptor ClpS [Planctomycetes bacterium]|nr:ATP-dependent Clp protease adaptor ClpS [Planctomycetota bacterium]
MPDNAAQPPADGERQPEAQTPAATAIKPAPAKPRPRHLPPWKVLLHNDDVNEEIYVVETIVMLTTLNEQDATDRMVEAHTSGVALLLTTHRERAELIQQQFSSRNLTVTIEPAEA